MRPPIPLTSSDNPRLKQLLHLRKPRDRRKAGLFIAEGVREVQRALAAGLTAREIFFSSSLLGLHLPELARQIPELESTSAPLFDVAPHLLAKAAYRDQPEGLLAVIELPVWTLDDLPPRASDDLFLIAAGISKPGNLGGMARTAAAAGVTALLTAEAEVDPFNPNAIRASTGAVFTLPILSLPHRDLLAFLTSRSAPLIAASPDAPHPYTAANLTGPLAILIGAEDTGLTPEWRSAATTLVSIPMHPGPVDSLNASVTAAVLLFECLRQRSLGRSQAVG